MRGRFARRFWVLRPWVRKPLNYLWIAPCRAAVSVLHRLSGEPPEAQYGSRTSLRKSKAFIKRQVGNDTLIAPQTLP